MEAKKHPKNLLDVRLVLPSFQLSFRNLTLDPCSQGAQCHYMTHTLTVSLHDSGRNLLQMLRLTAYGKPWHNCREYIDGQFRFRCPQTPLTTYRVRFHTLKSRCSPRRCFVWHDRSPSMEYVARLLQTTYWPKSNPAQQNHAQKC